MRRRVRGRRGARMTYLSATERNSISRTKRSDFSYFLFMMDELKNLLRTCQHTIFILLLTRVQHNIDKTNSLKTMFLDLFRIKSHVTKSDLL